LLLGTGGLWLSGVWFAADQHYRAAVSSMHQLSHTGGIQEQLTWQSAKTGLNAALSHRINIPLVEFQLGRLYEYRAADPYARDRQKIADRNRAMEYYEHAVKHRPTWSMAWTSLAYLQMLSSPEMERTSRSFKKAIQFAGHERAVRRRNAITGMIGWDYIDDSTRAHIENEMREFLNNPREARSLIRDAVGRGWVARMRPIGEEVLGVEEFDKRVEQISKR